MLVQTNLILSIVIPVYNSSKFLEECIKNIENQSFKDFEVIFIDDGSTDNSKEIIHSFIDQYEFNIAYHYQENSGADAARNYGLSFCKGEFIVFMDTDDLWYSFHLEKCVDALKNNPDVDVIFAANKIVNINNNSCLIENIFYKKSGEEMKVKALNYEQRGELKVITDPSVIDVQLEQGICAGIQFSAFRKSVFDKYRFLELRNCGDAFSVIELLMLGHRYAYFDQVHGIFRIHDSNSVAKNIQNNHEKYLENKSNLIVGCDILLNKFSFSDKQKQFFKRSMSGLYFWDLGYNLYWTNKQYDKAFEMFKRGLKLTPIDLRKIKTYIACSLKSLF